MEQNQNPYENPINDNQQNNPYQNSYPENHYRMPQGNYTKPNYFETAAFTLGIISIVTCSCIYGAYIFGALAIVFALLSRSGKMKMGRKAKTGLILAIIGIVLTTVFYAVFFYIALKEFGSIEGILREYCDMYGYDFNMLYGDFFR